MKKKLAVIILTWNDWVNTLKCLESIYQQKYKNLHVFIVDNNSKDQTFDKITYWGKNQIKVKDNLLKHKPKKIKILDLKNKKLSSKDLRKFKFIYLKNKKNLGCGFGHNTGYKVALKNNFEFISRIDNDMILPNNFFEHNA